MTEKIEPAAKAAPKTYIRSATKDDAPLILSFIRELAEYEKLAHEVTANEITLTKHLFGAQPRGECLIAEVDDQPAGFALFFHNFSTFLGKPGLYLEDLYVKPEFRSAGVGILLLRELARTAIARDCGRMEWSVLDWNEPAIAFYNKIGAQSMSDWTPQRLDRTGIERLAEEN